MSIYNCDTCDPNDDDDCEDIGDGLSEESEEENDLSSLPIFNIEIPEPMERKISLWDDINAKTSENIVRSLIGFAVEDTESPVELWINSPGGDLNHALAMYDIMQAMPYPIHTIGIGMVASCAVLILAAGTEGHRGILPNTRCMLHQVLYEGKGPLIEMEQIHKEAKMLQKKFCQLLSKHSKQDASYYQNMFGPNTDTYLSVNKSLKIGLADYAYTQWHE